MASKKVPIHGTDLDLIVQGFRGGDEFDPYVFVGVNNGSGFIDFEGSLSLESANILGEYLRQEAEFAASPRSEEEK